MPRCPGSKPEAATASTPASSGVLASIRRRRAPMVTTPFAWHSSRISFGGIPKMKLNMGTFVSYKTRAWIFKTDRQIDELYSRARCAPEAPRMAGKRREARRNALSSEVRAPFVFASPPTNSLRTVPEVGSEFCDDVFDRLWREAAAPNGSESPSKLETAAVNRCRCQFRPSGTLNDG